MNKKIVAVLITIFIIKQTHGDWKPAEQVDAKWNNNRLIVTNKTPHVLNIHAYFYACRDDHGYIQPGETLVSTFGLCYIQRLDIDGAGTVFRGPFSGNVFFDIELGPNKEITLKKVNEVTINGITLKGNI